MAQRAAVSTSNDVRVAEIEARKPESSPAANGGTMR